MLPGRDRFTVDQSALSQETPRSAGRAGPCDSSSLPILDRLISQRFQAEREPVAQDARLQGQRGAGGAGSAVDLEAPGARHQSAPAWR